MVRTYVLGFIASLLIIILAFLFQDKLHTFKNLGILGIFLINFFGSATIFFPTPAIASVVAGGVLYQPFIVGVVSALGASLGEMVGFFLGFTGKKFFIKNHNKLYGIFKDVFRKYGGIAIFVFAFIPNPFFDALGLIAGAFSYSPIRFFVWLFAGKLLRNILLAYLGHFLPF